MVKRLYKYRNVKESIDKKNTENMKWKQGKDIGRTNRKSIKIKWSDCIVAVSETFIIAHIIENLYMDFSLKI